MTDRRRQQLAFGAAVVGLWAVLAVIAGLSTPIHDDWYQVGWLKRGGGLSLELMWRELRYNYLHANPRIGDVFLLAVNGPLAVHVIVTPLVQLALLWLTFIAAFGALPAARDRDLRRLLVLQVAIWLTSPVPGVVYFYRPYATNYLFAFATSLAWFAPYRLALARATPDDRRRLWLVPVMLALGWAAGMSNEHTGMTAIAAAAIALGWAWRQRRLRAWMIAGALGLVVGYAMLLFSPGQAERYAGRAARFSVLGLIESRGPAGLFQVITGFLVEAQWAIDLTLIAVLAAVALHRRRGQAMAGLPRAALLAVVGALAGAGAIVGTLCASPVTTERLLFAPAVLAAGGLAVVLDHVCGEPRVRRVVTAVAALVFAYHAVRFVQVHVVAHEEATHRLALLAAAKPGEVVRVPVYATPHSRWYRGDDFRVVELREYVAHEIYGLAGIEYDRPPVWAQPTPVGTFLASRTYDPPLPPALAAQAPVPRFSSAFVGSALMLLRLHLGLDGWLDLGGHRLTRYQIDATGTGFVDPKHRPLHLVVWEPSGVRFVDANRPDDERDEPGIEIWPPSMPAGWTEAYVVGCGQTLAVAPVTQPSPPHDLLLPIRLACRQPYAGVVCDPQACWVAGRYARWK
ncbi:MAG TPA: DUF6056 family protein [Kofleriaceae bacterium]|nr:DUF6056 family protein [Kofleriaceae bacterium]